jgi:hypothetical protein
MGGGERGDGKLPCNEPFTVLVARLGGGRGRAPGRPCLRGPGHEQAHDHGEHEQDKAEGGHHARGYQGRYDGAWQASATEVEPGPCAT